MECTHPASVQDGAVACAAAQIAIQALLDLLYCGLLALQVALLDGCVGGCDKSRRARSTLQRVVAAVRLCRQTSVSLTQDYLIIVEQLSQQECTQSLRHQQRSYTCRATSSTKPVCLKRFPCIYH